MGSRFPLWKILASAQLCWCPWQAVPSGIGLILMWPVNSSSLADKPATHEACPVFSFLLSICQQKFRNEEGIKTLPGYEKKVQFSHHIYSLKVLNLKSLPSSCTAEQLTALQSWEKLENALLHAPTPSSHLLLAQRCMTPEHNLFCIVCNTPSEKMHLSFGGRIQFDKELTGSQVWAPSLY